MLLIYMLEDTNMPLIYFIVNLIQNGYSLWNLPHTNF